MCIHTYIHTYIHAYIHTYIHIYAETAHVWKDCIITLLAVEPEPKIFIQKFTWTFDYYFQFHLSIVYSCVECTMTCSTCLHVAYYSERCRFELRCSIDIIMSRYLWRDLWCGKFKYISMFLYRRTSEAKMWLSTIDFTSRSSEPKERRSGRLGIASMESRWGLCDARTTDIFNGSLLTH